MTPPVRPEDLARFVPTFLATRIAASSSPPTAGAEPAHAAVLFADISGFTALSERLAGQGPRASKR